MAHALLFWIMFYNFYSKNYKQPSVRRVERGPIPDLPATCYPCTYTSSHATDRMTESSRKLD